MSPSGSHKEEERTERYMGRTITTWVWVKDGKRIQFVCEIFDPATGRTLNLGECVDGSRFTSVNQSVNQAKEHISTCQRHGW